MTEPIRSKRPEVTAPTPQNTPLTNAPISSHAQEPGVTSITEEDMDRAAAASILRNPQIVQMIQGQLNSLVGRSSGYIESLPSPVQRRVCGLKGLQKDHTRLENELRAEVLEIEKKYFARFNPLYQRRSDIVNGRFEPTEDEVQRGDEEYSQSPRESDETGEPSQSNDAADDEVTGIPEFWLCAMKNQISLAEMITDRDEAALKHLIDVRMEYLERPGFRLIFEFSENDYFSNDVLKKTYYYRAESSGGDYIYDHASGDSILWRAGKDLTVRVEAKKQRNKSTKQTRIVKKVVPTESFFNFFSPPKPPADDDADDDDVGSDIEERLELDYQLGEDIKEKLIPRAIEWFTGEAFAYEEVDEDDIEHGDLDDDDDEEDDMSEDHDEDDEDDEDDESAKPSKEAAECKQS